MKIKDADLVADLRPVGSFWAKHGPDAPPRAKHVEWLWEAVVINDARIDGEDSHQQDDVAASKHHVEHLQRHKTTVCFALEDTLQGKAIWLVYVLVYLIVTLLGEEATFSDDQVEGSTGHQHAMTHVTKHYGKQEGESNDGVRSCDMSHTGQKHHTDWLHQLFCTQYE